MSEAYQPVPEFYAGKSVFITGGAGYLGKVLVEKLLYSCPDVEKVYLLLRDKKNVSAEQRFKSMLELPVFSRLRYKRPEDLSKIVLLKGDISVPNFNLKTEELATIREKVSIVIHSAASIKFNDPLKVAMKANVEGTRNVLNLCHSIKNIQVFVHVSTAFSNTNRKVIGEKVYTPSVTIDEVYKCIEQNDDIDHLNEISEGRPNTYTFTKALAEKLVEDTHGDIPVVIIRPSIVTPSIKEPVQGWVENWFGATGMLTSVGQGICRVVYTTEDQILDIIPVDYVCNLTLIAAARGMRPKHVSVYNSCSGSTNPINMKTLIDFYINESIKDKFYLLPNPNWVFLTKKFWLVRLITLLMLTFAQIADLIARLTMNRPRFTKLVSQSLIIRSAVDYFTSHSWIMRTDKSEALISSLSVSDKQLFPCQVTDINWREYMLIYYKGVKKYLVQKKKA